MTITQDTTTGDLLSHAVEHGIQELIELLDDAGDLGRRKAHGIKKTVRTMHDGYRRRVFGDEATDLLDELLGKEWIEDDDGITRNQPHYPRFHELSAEGYQLKKKEQQRRRAEEQKRAEEVLPTSTGSMGQDWFQERG